MSVETGRLRTAAVILTLVAVLISAQLVAGIAAPADGRAATGRVLGRTGFAFLGGLRTFTAAVLWNRLDPIHDGYYEGKSVAEHAFVLPSLRLITALDPQFVDAYYYAAFALAATGDHDGSIKVASEGVANNPNSGLMRANLVQMLMLQDKKKNLPQMIAQSRLGLSKNMHYDSADDAFESLVIYRTAFHLKGDKAMEAKLEAAAASLEGSGAVSSVQP